jgi:hypothetical protein
MILGHRTGNGAIKAIKENIRLYHESEEYNRGLKEMELFRQKKDENKRIAREEKLLRKAELKAAEAKRQEEAARLRLEQVRYNEELLQQQVETKKAEALQAELESHSVKTVSPEIPPLPDVVEKVEDINNDNNNNDNIIIDKIDEPVIAPKFDVIDEIKPISKPDKISDKIDENRFTLKFDKVDEVKITPKAEIADEIKITSSMPIAATNKVDKIDDTTFTLKFEKIDDIKDINDIDEVNAIAKADAADEPEFALKIEKLNDTKVSSNADIIKDIPKPAKIENIEDLFKFNKADEVKDIPEIIKTDEIKDIPKPDKVENIEDLFKFTKIEHIIDEPNGIEETIEETIIESPIKKEPFIFSESTEANKITPAKAKVEITPEYFTAPAPIPTPVPEEKKEEAHDGFIFNESFEESAPKQTVIKEEIVDSKLKAQIEKFGIALALENSDIPVDSSNDMAFILDDIDYSYPAPEVAKPSKETEEALEIEDNSNNPVLPRRRKNSGWNGDVFDSSRRNRNRNNNPNNKGDD